MPVYEYECESCKNKWEQEQSIKDPAIEKCPKCKKKKAKRLISSTSFVLAGGGWAKEGYSNK
jgi:putative FmdB family regulatory protein